MSDHVPTIAEVQGVYMLGVHRINPALSASDVSAEFDRWLGAHEREVAERAPLDHLMITPISTIEELAKLPVGSVILDLGKNNQQATAPVIACKAADGMWHVTGTPKDRRWRHDEVIRDSVGEGANLFCAYSPEWAGDSDD